MDDILTVDNLNKNFKAFKLKNVSFNLPKGYTVALVGSNGGGKTTLIDLIMGFLKKDSGNITYFSKDNSIESQGVKNRIGYVSDSNYFLATWKVKHVAKAMSAGFDNFNTDKFYKLVEKFNINIKQEITKMSKGTKMRLMLAAQLSRDTELLILDEPASPLDPFMRDELCDLFREYIKYGEKTVFFSTHNIADMEHVTDYVIVMENGQIIEQSFIEDLKGKYVVVRGDNKDISNIHSYLKNLRTNSSGFEGIAFAKDLTVINSLQDIAYETPSLQQIVVMLLKGANKNV